MKIPLCLCTIWSSIYINLSDGRNLIEDRSLEEVVYKVGTTGRLSVSYQSTFFMYCTGPCEIEKVEATLSDGDVKLTGYYGDGENSKFCEGLRSHGTGIANCKMLKNTGLSKARIKIDTYKESHNVTLIVRVYNFIKFSDEPQPFQDQLVSVVHNVGSIIQYQAPSYWIACRGPCEIEEVEAYKINGYIYGKYGNTDSEQFCEPVWLSDGTGIEKCEVSKKTGLSRARIYIFCMDNCDDVVLTVRGLNLIDIFEKPPAPKNITIHVGTLDKNQNKKYTFECTGGACFFERISTNYRAGGDVRMTGPIQNAIDSFYPNTFDNDKPKICPDLIDDSSLTLHGYKKSEEVILTVIGPHLESVDLERTWST